MTAPAPARRPVLGILALLAAAALWSLNGPIIKLLHGASVDAATIACLRSLMGGLLFLPLAWPQRHTLGRVHPAWPIACVLVFTIMTASFVKATTMTTAANAIILQYTSAIWVFLLSPLLLRESPRRAEGAALAIAMGGIAVLLMGQPRSDLPGLLVALLSGWGYGTLTVLLRGLRPVNAAVVSAMNSLGSGLLLLLSPGVLASAPGLDTRVWLVLLFMAVVQFTAPYFLFSWALHHVPAHRAGLIVLLEALLNPLWTYFAVGEVPTAGTFLGGALILGGVALTVIIAARTGRERGAAEPESLG